MDLPVTFYSVISNLIIIFNLTIIARAVYQVHKKHFYRLHRKPGIFFLVLFPLILCVSRIALIFSFITDNFAIYAFVDWLTALIVCVTAFKYNSFLMNVLRMEEIVMNQELADSLNNELYLRQQIQTDNENTIKNQNNMIKRLANVIENSLWMHDRQKAIDELEEILRVLQKNE